MSAHSPKLLALLIAFALTLSACGREDPIDEPDTGEVDAGPDATDEPDADVGDDPDADAGEEPDHGDRVPLDLRDYVVDVADSPVNVYEVTDPADLIPGDGASGQVGDFILENDVIRVLVEADRRSIGPCPWGGNIIDVEHRSDRFVGDVLGGFCLFLNADQTFKPETYEILHDGSDGTGVLAITVRTALLDFVNLKSMLGYLLPGGQDLFQVAPDDLMPLKITKYYILQPGSESVQVVTRILNEDDERWSIIAAFFFVGSGEASAFNPLSGLRGFGNQPTGLTSAQSIPLSYLALVGDDGGVGFVPRPDLGQTAGLPTSGSYISIFNLLPIVLGRGDVLTTLLATEQQISQMDGILHLNPDEIGEIEYRVYPSDGSLATMVDPIYRDLGVDHGTVSGQVLGPDGEPVANAPVTAVNAANNRSMNQVLTDDDGHYSMVLPAADYQLTARLPGQRTLIPVEVSVDAGGAPEAPVIEISEAGFIHVQVQNPAGDPVPARVSLICIDNCEIKPRSTEEDIIFDQLPDHFATIEWVGVDGELTFPYHPGTYRLAISRGMEWSTWPSDAHLDGGALIEVEAGQTVEIQAEIDQVIDSEGFLSGDFHVHAISSFDSTTPEEDRVLTFLTEGVDVIVSTDHDVIADFGPAAAALGATDHITTLVGSEITTSDLGHFNAFPLERDPSLPNGGALDWADGENPALPPAEIFAWMREHPGEQVVQINHPDSSFFSYADVLRGITYGDPQSMRVNAEDPDPDTGDIGLWSDEFTALELFNGHNVDRYWGVMRWWLTLVGRGHRVTATAVTDTHRRFGDTLGAAPRTFVEVGPGFDTTATFDTARFVDAVNAQQAFGTTGPFVRVLATNINGDTAGLGQVITTDGEPVTFTLEIQVPEWIEANRVELLTNLEDVVTDAGEYITTPLSPTETFPFELTADDLEVVSTGEYTHRRYRKTLEIEVDTDVDAYVVFLVRGDQDMAPVVPFDDVLPFAFTNPIYLDTDGDGYSEPPLLELSLTPPPANAMMLHAPPIGPRQELSEEQLRQLLDQVELQTCH